MILLNFIILVTVQLNELIPEGLHGLPGLLVLPLHPALNADPDHSKTLVRK